MAASYFSISRSILLILFAAGLLAHGIHELQEAGVIPILLEPLWDITPKDGSMWYHLLHKEGVVGSFLKHVFGYDPNPSLLQVMGYVGYIMMIIITAFCTCKNKLCRRNLGAI